MDKLNGLSKDLEQTAREKLASVFPECFVEGKLDIDKLLNLCGEYMLQDFEKYEFIWKGKSECYPIAQQRSIATLRPCPHESVNFDTTQNLYIEGDNLEVLKLLQTSYFRKVKMIYIDPPYNTGNDFVYEDDFKDPLERYKEVTSQTTKSNPEYMGRFHTRWLNMMFPRLRLAANLLRDDGVIFISIDDHEVHNLRKLCDEVFGEEHFVGCFVWKRRTSSAMDQSKVSTDHEYVLCYNKYQFMAFKGIQKDYAGYANPDNDPRGIWTTGDLTVGMNGSMRPNQYYDLVDPETGKVYPANYNRVWSYAPESMQKLIEEKRVLFPEDTSKRPMLKRFANELKSNTNPFSTWMTDIGLNTEGTKAVYSLFDNVTMFNYAKPLSLIENMIRQTTQGDDIILDFFSGSATTAHAVMQLNAEDNGNRRFIMVQLPELCDEKSEAYKAGYKNICEIGKERIRRAGARLIENSAQKNPQLDIGFKVFKLDSSNLKLWDASRFPEDDLVAIGNRLHDMIDRIKPDRTDLDVVYELMLKLGVPLTYSVIPMEITGGNPDTRKTAYSIGEECLVIICLADNLTTEMIEEMAEYTPGQIILAEHSLSDLSAMRNAHYVLRDRNIVLKLV